MEVEPKEFLVISPSTGPRAQDTLNTEGAPIACGCKSAGSHRETTGDTGKQKSGFSQMRDFPRIPRRPLLVMIWHHWLEGPRSRALVSGVGTVLVLTMTATVPWQALRLIMRGAR